MPTSENVAKQQSILLAGRTACQTLYTQTESVNGKRALQLQSSGTKSSRSRLLSLQSGMDGVLLRRRDQSAMRGGREIR